MINLVLKICSFSRVMATARIRAGGVGRVWVGGVGEVGQAGLQASTSILLYSLSIFIHISNLFIEILGKRTSNNMCLESSHSDASKPVVCK